MIAPFILLLILANCKGDETAEGPAPDPALVAAGEPVYAANCGVCHANQTTGIAPGLGGLMGRQAGAETFPYSEAFLAADFTWTPEQLDAFLTDPRATVPDNLMAFYGLPSADDRAALIAYISTLEP